MSKSRIKIPLVQLNTRAEAEEAISTVAALTNKRRIVAAQMDKRLLAIKEEYEAELGHLDKEIAAGSDSLRAWAEANPQEFPKGRKSIEFLAGTLGFRTGTPKLALLSRAWTWDKVLAAIEAFSFQFIRNTPAVDKEAILAFAAAEADKARLEAKVLRPIGLKIVQDESFYVEPKLTEPEVAK